MMALRWVELSCARCFPGLRTASAQIGRASPGAVFFILARPVRDATRRGKACAGCAGAVQWDRRYHARV